MSDSNNKRNVIQLSFKNEGADLELYNFLKQKLSAPAYIKEEMWNIYKNGAPLVQRHIDVTSITPIHGCDLVLPEEEAFSDLFQEDANRDEVEF